MEIKNTVNQYNEQRNRHCKTLEDIVRDVVEDTLQAIDSDINELINDVKSGDCSLNEIAERLEEIREKTI